jgi:hypothetical protein
VKLTKPSTSSFKHPDASKVKSIVIHGPPERPSLRKWEQPGKQAAGVEDDLTLFIRHK